ncbi:MAG: deoxyguanosinetriphosphate triphosphohydrolase [Oscillospiraceae bacterium]|nr:deoxyguanosinetriphosphate triphosphohydrolase [Oscillospiraceae bacterium]
MLESPRIAWQRTERQILSDWATLSEISKGRRQKEPECDVRTCYQRDIDRIIHSKSFRRLKHKTQVFLQPEGDHYRTRLTHTLEVMRIARTIARGLQLNEDLAEAIALGHDLGHTPFGHAGERVLNELLSSEGGFKHNEQSLRVVERLEKDGRGLNLTYEVENGILCHTGAVRPSTPEGEIIRLADRIAYFNHDVDDAVRAGILREMDIPEEITCALGNRSSERINTLVFDVISESAQRKKIAMSPNVDLVFNLFYDFMFKNVYRNMKAKSEETKVFGILNGIFGYYVDNPDKLPEDYRRISAQDGLRRAVSDYVSGMTDKYAIHVYEKLFVPEAWQVR